ncbi:MAG TPA: TetR/AcrR family transcriptional regulator [Clostridia bacterium]|nr:TetR/AcrR family transcriptional regulator [Clostridia bacterium]
MEPETNQRVRLTKKLLKDALITLMQEKHISEISVRALCELAGINRSTFYSHYSDPNALLHSIEQEVMSNLKKHLEKQPSEDKRGISSKVMVQILEYAKANASVFKVLLSENCEFDVQKDVLKLSRIVSFKFNPRYSKQTQEYLTLYGTTGAISILHKWLQDGMIEQPEEISELLLRVLFAGYSSFE